MKNKHLRTAAVITLLSTVFLAGCSGSKTETAETQVTSEPVVEVAETQTLSESILPVAEAAENTEQVVVSANSKLLNTFSNERVSVVGQATSFPSGNDVTYFIKDKATGATFMYIITRGQYGDVLGTCVTKMTN